MNDVISTTFFCPGIASYLMTQARWGNQKLSWYKLHLYTAHATDALLENALCVTASDSKTGATECDTRTDFATGYRTTSAVAWFD